jgi:nucleoside-diphosphate-sugar epimerase
VKEMLMEIVVIGGTGLIGSKHINKLQEHAHEAVAATPKTGVKPIPGEDWPKCRILFRAGIIGGSGPEARVQNCTYI